MTQGPTMRDMIVGTCGICGGRVLQYSSLCIHRQPRSPPTFQAAIRAAKEPQ